MSNDTSFGIDSNEKIITHNDLSHECYAMSNWEKTLKKFTFEKSEVDMVFLDEIQLEKFDKFNFVKEFEKKCDFELLFFLLRLKSAIIDEFLLTCLYSF